MWSMRVSNDILHTCLYESNLIKDLWEIRDEDIGYVSYGLRGRLFNEDLPKLSIKSYGEHEYVGDWREGGDRAFQITLLERYKFSRRKPVIIPEDEDRIFQRESTIL